MRLLHLDSSADVSAASRSRSITAAFATAFRDASPENTVVYRDLHTTPPPHLPHPSLHWAKGLRPQDIRPGGHPEELQRELVDELLSADVVLIGYPLYNYGLPSTVKAWLDHIHVPGLTAPATSSDPSPLAGRPLILVTSRGGDYAPGTINQDRDHATPVLELILGTEMGMTVSLITTTLTLQPNTPRAQSEYTTALTKARTLATHLTT
ncbi:NAD(P)H-dependent oxidoreductase [Actinocorallia lasiicapitis]